MVSKGYKRSMSVIVASILIMILLVGCGAGEISENSFCGVWDYPEYNVRLHISEDDTWEMLDEKDAALAGGNLVKKGDSAELYYGYGSPWGNDDGTDMYTVLHFKSKKKLSDGMGNSLYLTD